MSDTASTVSSGFAIYGRIRAVIISIFLILGIIVLIAFGVDRLNDKHTAEVMGTVSSITPPGCTSITDNKGNIISYTCPVTVSYIVNGTTYTISTTLNQSTAATVGQGNVNVQYIPTDPKDGVVEEPPKDMAYLFFGIAGFIFVLMVVNLYFMFKSQSYATVMGGAAIAGGLLRR